MNHLTTKEIFQIVDGTIANGEKSRLVVHLEECQRCRREVEFQRTLERGARDLPPANPSKGFKARVLGRIAPETKKSWTTRIVNNLGNIMAMGLVLTIVWYAITSPAALRGTAEPSAISKAFAVYVEYYSRARDFASAGISKVVGEPKKEQSVRSDKTVMLTVFSVLILVVIDRFVVRRVIKIRG